MDIDVQCAAVKRLLMRRIQFATAYKKDTIACEPIWHTKMRVQLHKLDAINAFDNLVLDKLVAELRLGGYVVGRHYRTKKILWISWKKFEHSAELNECWKNNITSGADFDTVWELHTSCQCLLIEGVDIEQFYNEPDDLVPAMGVYYKTVGRLPKLPSIIYRLINRLSWKYDRLENENFHHLNRELEWYRGLPFQLAEKGNFEGLKDIWTNIPECIEDNAYGICKTAIEHGHVNIAYWAWKYVCRPHWKEWLIQYAFSRDYTLACYLAATLSAVDWWKNHDSGQYNVHTPPIKTTVMKWIQAVKPKRVKFMATIAPELNRNVPLQN